MQKTFLKFLTYELVERLARFEAILDEFEGQPSGTQAAPLNKLSPALLAHFRREIEAIKAKVAGDKSFINPLFGDEPAAESKALGAQLERCVYEPYAALCGLSDRLQRLYKGLPSDEIYLFLKEALPEKFIQQREQDCQLTVVLDAEGDNAVCTDWDLDGVLVPSLSILQKDNPLSWVTLNRTFARQLFRESALIQPNH